MRGSQMGRVRSGKKWQALAGAVGMAVLSVTIPVMGGAALAAPATTQPTVEDLMQKINDL